jgi:hypothetical protein
MQWLGRRYAPVVGPQQRWLWWLWFSPRWSTLFWLVAAAAFYFPFYTFDVALKVSPHKIRVAAES